VHDWWRLIPWNQSHREYVIRRRLSVTKTATRANLFLPSEITVNCQKDYTQRSLSQDTMIEGQEQQDGAATPMTTPMGMLPKLAIPENKTPTPQQNESIPGSSSGSSLFLSSSPPTSAGIFTSPPITPISSTKSPPSRNDIFSEEWTNMTMTRSPVIGRTGNVKERPKELGSPGGVEQVYDVWDTEARKRRSGASTWGWQMSRSSTPTNNDDSSLRINFSNLLGRGLTSVVYSATLPTSKVVAAKIPTNEGSKRVLEREATMLNYLHSLPHSTEYIIPFYGKYPFDDTFALCLELCPQTMQGYISARMGSSFPVVGLDIWKSWLSTLLSAVEFLHRSGVLHNDIKPQNILLTASLYPYLSDFAVSTSLYGIDLPSPPDMHILGTTVYTAPELLSAEDVPTTPESNIYSLGISMFVAAMGMEPFGWTRSITQKIMLKKRGDIFAGMDIWTSSPIIDIIKGMCTAEPYRRWNPEHIRHALHNL
jgi:hypothetical protein